MHFRIFLTVAITSALSACLPAYQVPLDEAPSVDGFQVVDARPAAEKAGSGASLLIPSCTYGIKVFGDSDLSPPPMKIIESELRREFGNSLRGMSLSIASFKVVQNNQSWLRQSVHGGGSYTPFKSIECIAGPEIDGSNDENLNPQGLPSCTVIIKANVRGKDFSEKYFRAMTVDEMRTMNTRQLVSESIKTAIHELGQEIGAASSVHAGADRP